MKIIFVSIGIPDLSTKAGSFYADLIYELADKHDVTVISPSLGDNFSGIRTEGKCRVVRVQSKPFQGNYPLFKKGMRLLKLNNRYERAYDKYLKGEKFDFIIMPTPPMNLVDVCNHIKEESGAKLYLILRDIHPECLDRKHVSSEVLNRKDVFDEAKKPYGVNLLVYRYLYRKAQKLYSISDIIACMSPGNITYIQSICKDLNHVKLVVLPNWYNYEEQKGSNDSTSEIRRKYGLEGKFIAIFGGTIGEAQAVWNIAALAKHNLNKSNVVFLIVGRGCKKDTLKQIAEHECLTNMKFIDYMPKEEYEQVLKLADIGLISIDEKYSVPTCPSKIIGYMALSKPVLAILNKGNDYGEYYITNSGCGFWTCDLNYEEYFQYFDQLYYDENLRLEMGKNGKNFLLENLSVARVAELFNNQIK